MKPYARPLNQVRNRKTVVRYLACVKEPFQVLKRGEEPALFDDESEALQFAEQWIAASMHPQSIITWYRPSGRMPPDDKWIWIAVNGEAYRAINRFGSWRIDNNTTLHRDPDWWAELPEVPGE